MADFEIIYDHKLQCKVENSGIELLIIRMLEIMKWFSLQRVSKFLNAKFTPWANCH